jgi:hypothetical protein
MAKKKAGSQIGNLTPDHLKSGITPISLCASGVSHTVGKLSMRNPTLLQTSFQYEVYTQSYGPPKSWRSQLWEFWDSHLGVLGPNDIWVPVPWPSIEYTIRGKVVASLKSGPWWVLWIHIRSWLVCAPKCSNDALINLLFGLCKSVWMIKLLINLPSPSY